MAVPRTLAALLPYWWTRRHCPGAAPEVTAVPRWFLAAMLLLAVVSGWQLFSHLDYPLFEPDEGRYAEIGHEMLANDHWIVPSLHQRPYLDKPPLFYWLLGLSFKLFGLHDWAARIVPAAAAWLTILATGLGGRRIVGDRAALLAAATLTLSLGFMFTGRFLVLDSVLSLFVTLSMLTAYEAVRAPRVAWTWWLACAACCALGCLTKGPVALCLTLPPLVAHCWLHGRLRATSWLHWTAFLAIVTVIVLPWFALVVAAQPDFLRYFLLEHHIARFLSGLNHPEPFWYYVPILLAGSLPWTPLLVPWLHFMFSPRPAVAALRSQGHGFLLLGALWCLVFFSAASCKLPPYILPAAPALALLFGSYLNQLTLRCDLVAVFPRWLRVAPYLGAGTLALTLSVLSALAYVAELVSLGQVVLFTALAWGCVLPSLLRPRMAPAAAWALCALVTLLFMGQIGHKIMPAFAQSRSPAPRLDSELASALGDPHNGVIVYGRECGSIPFYFRRAAVPCFDATSTDPLTASLRRYPRTVLVTRFNVNAEEIKRLLPDDVNISHLGNAGRSSLWLIDVPVRSAERADAAQRQ